jgi:hypothetical protein
MAEITPYGLTDGVSALTDSKQNGVFTFFGRPSTKYRIYYGGGYSGIKGTPKTVDTASGKDMDVGDMVFGSCPAPSNGASLPHPKAPTSGQLVGDLQLEQIVIEPRQPRFNYGLSLPASRFLDTNYVEVPQCWSGPSLDRRTEWELLPSVRFDHFLSIKSFVGGRVKTIRVVRYDPALTPSQIREEVRKVWLGLFSDAESGIFWSEGNLWNIEASVEYEDGKQSSILMDAWVHVQVGDREGKYWYIRLLPAL